MEIRSSIIGPLVERLRRQLHLTCFVESGTCFGDTAELAAIAFDEVYTCEIDPALVAEATRRLAPYSNVIIANMESPKFFREIKSRLDRPTMFWLDGHWCGGPVRPNKECPLLEELEAIGGLRGHSAILADDIGYMQKPPPHPHDSSQWPTMDQIYQVIDGWGESVSTSIEHGPRTDVLVITPDLNPVLR